MREVTKVKKIGKGNMSREYIFSFRVLVLLKHPNVGYITHYFVILVKVKIFTGLPVKLI